MTMYERINLDILDLQLRNDPQSQAILRMKQMQLASLGRPSGVAKREDYRVSSPRLAAELSEFHRSNRPRM